MTDQESAQKTHPSRSNWILPLAILLGATIVAAAIFVTTRTDECDEWNKRVRSHVREAEFLASQARNAPPDQAPTQEEAREILSRVRTTLAEQPETCEISSDTADRVIEMMRRISP